MWLLCLLATSANAWEVLHTGEGDAMRFQEMPVAWNMDLTNSPSELGNDEQRRSLQNAFETWMAIEDADVAFVQEDDGIDVEGANHVYWHEEWEWDPALLALTSTWATDAGELVGFEIRINAEYDEWGVNGTQDKMDLQNAITHEVGHALALDHSLDEQRATMYPTASIGETDKRNLEFDDEEAARFLYGAAVAATASGCSTAPAASSGLAAALSVATLVLRRPGRKS
jgi:hypothetical protein